MFPPKVMFGTPKFVQKTTWKDLGIPTLGLAGPESKAHSGCRDKGNSYYFLVKVTVLLLLGVSSWWKWKSLCKGCFPGGGFFPPCDYGKYTTSIIGFGWAFRSHGQGSYEGAFPPIFLKWTKSLTVSAGVRTYSKGVVQQNMFVKLRNFWKWTFQKFQTSFFNHHLGWKHHKWNFWCPPSTINGPTLPPTQKNKPLGFAEKLINRPPHWEKGRVIVDTRKKHV